MNMQEKISGRFRSVDGPPRSAGSDPTIATIQRNGGNVIEALRTVFAGHANKPSLPHVSHPRLNSCGGIDCNRLLRIGQPVDWSSAPGR